MAEAVIDRPLRQAFFPGMSPVEDALAMLSSAGIEERGAVFTRREVVDFILDLVGYTPDRPLHELRLLEPSVGHGEFLVAVVERLLTAWQSHAHGAPIRTLADAIRSVELHQASYEEARGKVVSLLRDRGVSAREAKALVQDWCIQGDFLLTPLPDAFDYVVGNPPYVRQELIPDALIAEYRARYRTIFDRADIYIPFIERSLSLLADDGSLGFICADRWMKNRYGGPLRQMVAEHYHLKIYVDMYDTPAFLTDVIAYPAITVIKRDKPGDTRVARQPTIDKDSLGSLSALLLAEHRPDPQGPVKQMAGVTAGAQPWILDSSDQLALVRRLERDFPGVEAAGCKVGIGVATGADKAFIGPFDELDVEEDRKLPLVMTRDIDSGNVQWRGLGIVNPFANEGGLVDLRRYPRLRRHLEARRDQIAGRHIAQKMPANWYRTIDRIYPALAAMPKLLIPDIKGEPHIVYEDGKLYPHHNLYFITSDEWDLQALQAVLRSGIARLFVATYSTRMRGGYLRFQAQYLRRIRLPRWRDVAMKTRKELVAAAAKGDVAACNRAVFQLYGLSAEEQATLGGSEDAVAIDLVNYEQKAREAVQAFWGNREKAKQKQVEAGKADQGERAGVTAGKNMDGFIALIIDIIQANGLRDASIHLNRSVVTLPGYFRPTKLWDLLVVNKGRLVAALEFKSHVGPSFGNNFNNRTEEAIGTAHDLWVAYREGAFGKQPRPFVGWMIIVEDAPTSRRPVTDRSPHFPVFKEFQGASYLERYNILCQRLMLEQLYSAASVIASPRSAADNGRFTELDSMTGLQTFITEFAGHIAAEAAR